MPALLAGFLEFILIISVITNFSDALYEDQVGKFDWRVHYFGKLKYAYIDPSASGTQKFVVATEQNVLASLQTRNGVISWRQVLEKGELGTIDAISSENELIVVSGGGLYVRSFDSSTGVLNWEKNLPNLPSKLDKVFNINAVAKEITVVHIHPASHVVVSVYSIVSASMKTTPQIPATWITRDTSCSVISHQYFVCFDLQSLSIQVMYLNKPGNFRTVPLASLGLERNEPPVTSPEIVQIAYQEKSDEPYFALHFPDSGYAVLQLRPSGIRLAKLLPEVSHITSSIINNKLAVATLVPAGEGNHKLSLYSVEDWEKLSDLQGEFHISSDHGAVEGVHIMPFYRKDRALSYKILVHTEDHSIHLFHQQGKVFWTREEALASVISAEFIDLPLSETDAKIEQEFGASSSSILSILMTRITTQMFQLQSFLMKFLESLQGISQQSPSATGDLTRDKFGFHKVIVITTSARKIFVIDNLSGQIVWSVFVKDLSPFMKQDEPYLPIYVQRTTAHKEPQCTVFGKHIETGNAYLVSFNPISGKIVDQTELPYEVLQVTALQYLDKNYLRGLLILDKDLQVHTYPASTKDVLLEYKSNQYMFTADPDTGMLVGYSLIHSSEESLRVDEVWKVVFPKESQTITHIAKKKSSEHVHSQGRVMGDRSVLYKYLNPNLVAVVTEGADVQKQSTIHVYLIDVITGAIIYSVSHKRARGPIHIVHSENWSVYSYYNEKARRMEMSAIELYEGKSQSNTTAFSSLTPPPPPLVEHQTYIFPSSVESMVVTETEKGITSKHLLVALPSGGIVEIPKAFLDPRRPVHPTAEHREEGLIPYVPELALHAENIVNYNQSVLRIRGISTASSGLESTCLVIAYGLDIFYTRVTPSKTFDILKDDFEYALISGVLILLILCSVITKKFAARKALKAAWK